MGVVYRAHDTLLERVVALKVIASSIGENAELRERFFREARAAGQLSHPNIITIHDLGEHEGQPYLAMEYLTGEDLQRRLARPEPMSLARKLEIAAEICDGLSFAHRRGVIHRDIKPANIFITDEGVVKILDFGLARMVASEVTASNMMLGTLNYMAPEQVRGERTDHRADIFSFGVVLYEVLSGRKAFQGDSYATTLYKILQEVPEPLLNIDASLPPDLVRLVERALAKPRDERYQDLTELARDLAVLRDHVALSGGPAAAGPRPSSDPPRSNAGWIDSQSVTGTHADTTPGAPTGRRKRWISAAAVLAVAAGAAVWIGLRSLNPNADLEPTLEQQPATQTAAPPPAPTPAPGPETSAPAPSAAAPEAPSADDDRDGDAVVRRTADAARDRMLRARNTARAAGNNVERSPAYRGAVAAEREAQSLYKERNWSDATAKFYEAMGLYQSAGATAAAAARARTEPAPAGSSGDTQTSSAAPPKPEESPAPPPGSQSAEPPAARGSASSAGASEPARQPSPVPPPPAPLPETPVAVPPPLPPITRPERNATAAKPPDVSPEEGVRELLRKYEHALEERSIQALRQLWPGLSGGQEQAIRNEFQYARQLQVDITNVDINVSGATATATFIRRYQLSTVDGQNLTRTSRTTMAARRNGNAWVIERLHFEPLR